MMHKVIKYWMHLIKIHFICEIKQYKLENRQKRYPILFQIGKVEYAKNKSLKKLISKTVL